MAVLAIDPSSPITGGAILGDRVRMQAHAGDRDVFIRSMASRGHAGGLAAATVAAAAVLDASGFPLVFIETVGTGQSEVEVAAIADTTLVVQAPEMGDEVQAIKAGLLEVADIVVVNKADRPGAQRAAAQLRAMLTVGAQHDRAAAEAVARRPNGRTCSLPPPRPETGCQPSWPRSTAAMPCARAPMAARPPTRRGWRGRGPRSTGSSGSGCVPASDPASRWRRWPSSTRPLLHTRSIPTLPLIERSMP